MRSLIHNLGRPGATTRPTFRPRIDPLEDRLFLTTFTVINTKDSGLGSLRQAILGANAASGEDEIEFPARHLPGDGVAGRHVALRVVGRDRDPLAVAEPALSQALHHAGDAGVEHRGRGMLHDRDAQDPARGRVRTALTIGVEQERRRGGDEDEPQRQVAQGLPEGDGELS